MENVTIHVYEPVYREAVVTLILHIQRNEFSVPITREQQPDLDTIGDFYQKGNGNFWVALHHHAVVGTIALIDIGNEQVALRKMFVDEKFRGKGYQTGQKLLDAALDWMDKKGCRQVFLGTLDVFRAAQKFYRRNGFAEIARHALPATFPAMKLDNAFFQKSIEPGKRITIETYRPEHQLWFEKFNRDWIERYFWMEPVDFQVLQRPEDHIVKPGGTILMAKYDGMMAGTVALKFVEPGIYEFTKMAVDEKFQGRKIGKALADAAIEKARELGARKIILYSNTILDTAIILYRKLGFQEIPVDGPYKRSNIKMELTLSAFKPVT